MSVRSAQHWSDGCCTTSIMLRTGPRVTPTVATHRTARSRSVPRPPQRTSRARQSSVYGKHLQVSHPLRLCQARQGKDGTAQRVEAGNQQEQYIDGGESASRSWRTLSHPCWRHGNGLTRLQRACSHIRAASSRLPELSPWPVTLGAYALSPGGQDTVRQGQREGATLLWE